MSVNVTRRRHLALAVAVVVCLSLVPPALAESRSAGLERSVVHEINSVRRAHGVGPLVLSAKLSAAARQHTREMGSAGYFEHESADHSAFSKRLERFYPWRGCDWKVGENLLYQSPDVSPGEVVRMWLDSPEHRSNLLSPSWREVGVAAIHFDSAPGTYAGQSVTIVTADFGARRCRSVPPGRGEDQGEVVRLLPLRSS